MSGIMMSTIASYPKVSSGSFLLGTNLSNVLTTGITAPGTDDCTYELWYYMTSFNAGNNDNITLNCWINGNGTSSGPLITMYGVANGYFATGPVSQFNTGSFLPVLNTWTHLALTIAAGGGAGSAILWVNGVNRGTGLINDIAGLTSTELALGGRGFTGMLGYISNFRYVKGVQVYTGNFTPPSSPLTATQSAGTNISAITAGQTQLLLNTATAGTYLTDSSSYARTMTPTGTISYSSLNPFS